MSRKVITNKIKNEIAKAYLDGTSFQKIKDIFGICSATIDNVANKLNLPRDRRQSRKKYDRKEVCDLYLSGMTTREVAQKIGGSSGVIAHIILMSGISRPREIRKSVLDNMGNKCPEFSSSFVDYLDGLMISDGCLTKPYPNGKTSSYRQSCVCREWLEEIQEKFLENGIKSRIVLEKRKIKRPASSDCYVLSTLRYDKFYDQFFRWYVNNNKIVPHDIKFSLSMLKNWVYGDGTRSKDLRLCCDSFSKEDIDFLLDLFAKNGFVFKMVFMGLSKAGTPKYRLSLNKTNGLLRFMSMLGEPLECFKYKWQHPSKKKT